MSGLPNALSRQLFLCTAVLAGLLASCSNQPIMPGGALPPPNMTIVAPKEPPAPQAEVVPDAPQGPPGYFAWEPGHWHWAGLGYVWVSGHYIERPYQASVWVPGAWNYDGALHWTWTPGHWK
jgi:hypothetical protein